MKKNILVFSSVILSFILSSTCQAYNFDNKMLLEVIEKEDYHPDHIVLEIKKHYQENKNLFPVGTKIFTQTFHEQAFEFFNLQGNPRLNTKVSKIVLPNGKEVSDGNYLLELQTVSQLKSYLIPFYRLTKMMKNTSAVQTGDLFNLKAQKANSFELIAVRKKNTN